MAKSALKCPRGSVALTPPSPEQRVAMDDVHDIRDDNCHPGLLHVPAVTEVPAHEAQGEACAVAVEQPSPAAVDGVHERPLPDEADEPDAKRCVLCAESVPRAATATETACLVFLCRTLTGRDIFLRGGPKKELGAGQVRKRVAHITLGRSNVVHRTDGCSYV